MNILLMNGSPKKASSASRTILLGLEQYIREREKSGSSCTVTHCQALEADIAERVKACNILVLAFPLYVDGVPSHLLSVMEKLQRAAAVSSGMRIYAIVNCGFYEGEHCRTALEIASHWCARCGGVWGGGLGFGGGGGLDMMDSVPMGYGPKKSLGTELGLIAEDIFAGSGTGLRYARVNFPSFLYKLGGQTGWVMMAKANGLGRTDLSRRL